MSAKYHSLSHSSTHDGNHPVSSFFRYYTGTILRPHRTFSELLEDNRRLQFGFWALAINALLYAMVYVFLAHGGGAPSSFPPWLAISREEFYQYDRFILAPSMFGCWILAAGVAQLLSKAFSGKGMFEDMLSVFGYAISIACLASLLHDLPDSFLGAIGLINLREYEIALNSPTVWRTILLTLYSISIVWFIVLFTEGVAAAQRMRRGPAFVVALCAYIYQGVFLIFNR